MTGKAAEKGALAMGYFQEGYNCSQSVLLAFAPECGLERETALRLASSFGGGFGRMRELCGALSGAGIALGLIHGGFAPGDKEGKQRHYQRVQLLCDRFEAIHGHLRCGDLLEGCDDAGGRVASARTPEYYATRPCGRLCYDAAAVLAEELEELAVSETV